MQQVRCVFALSSCQFSLRSGSVSELGCIAPALWFLFYFLVVDRVISKLGVNSKSQLVVEAASPTAVAVAGAVALRASALLHLNSSVEDLEDAKVINDSALS